MAKHLINTTYGVNVLGNIRERLTSLGGFAAFLHEIIQNAEDSECAWLRFEMSSDLLTIRNPSEFDQDDWDRITEIAHGGKRPEKIGTFGVGFTSVFQFTDEPTIISSDQKATIKLAALATNRPDLSIATADCLGHKGTTFLLPWARHHSDVRERLGQPAISEANIDSFWREVPAILDTALLFLRNLQTVDFIWGKRVIAVQREDTPCQAFDGVRRSITVTESDDSCRKSEWLVARAQVEHDKLPKFDRDPELGLALPLVGNKSETGGVFAFLPTQHQTHLPFHIHGRFFAKADRKGIERDGLGERVKWNSCLFEAIADLFAARLKGLVAELGHHDALALLPPATFTCEEFPELDGLVPAVIEAEANGLRLLVDRQSTPREGRSLYLTGALPEPLVVTAEACGAWFIDTRIERHFAGWTAALGVQPLRFGTLESLPTLQTLRAGTDVQNAPQVLTDSASRARLYELVAHLLTGETGDTTPILSRLPIAVSSRGKLQPPMSLWLAAPSAILLFGPWLPSEEFWASNIVEQVPSTLQETLPWFCLSDAIQLLEKLPDLPATFRNKPNELFALYSELVRDWPQEDLDQTLRQRFAALPIWLRADGSLNSCANLALPSSFHDPLGTGFVLDATEIAARTSAGTLQKLVALLSTLDVRELDFPKYCRVVLPRFSKSIPQSVTSDLKQRLLSLLDLLRSRLRDYQDDQQITRALGEIRLVPTQAGPVMSVGELYWPSETLDRVFGENGYPVPMHSDKADEGPSWREMYEVLGIAFRPRMQHVSERVIRLATTPFSKQRTDAIKAVFEYLDGAVDRMSGPDLEILKRLASVTWFPIYGDEGSLARPCDTSSLNLLQLIGTQTKFMAFGTPRSALSEALGIRTKADTGLVVKHLRSLASSGSPASPSIYQHLNDNASDQRIAQLKGTPAIDIGDGKYLSGHQIFFDPASFGAYRPHLPEGLTKYPELFRMLGVKSSSEITAADLCVLLEEVCGHFSPTNRIPDEDSRKVIHEILTRLGRLMTNTEQDVRTAAAELRDRKCLPRADCLLVQPNKLVIKDKGFLAKEFEGHLGTHLVDKDADTWRVLHLAFGVPMLSTAVKTVVTAREGEAPDRKATAWLHERDHFVRRVVESLRRSYGDGWERTSVLGLSVHKVRRLEARYSLEVVSTHTVGPKALPAYFDKARGVLLLGCDEQIDSSAFARVLAEALNPEIGSTLLTPLLREIMQASDLGTLDDVLSDYDVDLLGDATESPGGVNSVPIESIGTTHAEVSPDDDASLDVEANGQSPVAQSEGASSGRQVQSAAQGGPEAPSEPEPSNSASDDSPLDAGADSEYSEEQQRDNPETVAGGRAWADEAPNGAGGRTPLPTSGPSDHASRGTAGSTQPRPSTVSVDSAQQDRSRASEGQRESQPSTGSAFENAPNWFRMRIASERAEATRDPEGERERGEAASDAIARQVVVRYEERCGRKATPAPKLQRGYDVLSVDPTSHERRYIEVKGVGSSWEDDATVRLTRAQFDDARSFRASKDDYWVYIVDRLSSGTPRVRAIRNPSRSSAWFFLQAQDWLKEAEPTAEITSEPAFTADSGQAPLEGQAERATAEFLQDAKLVVSLPFHGLIDSLSGFPPPDLLFSHFESDEAVGIMEIAWVDRKVAILLPEQAALQRVLELDKWRVLVLTPNVDVTAIREQLGGLILPSQSPEE